MLFKRVKEWIAWLGRKIFEKIVDNLIQIVIVTVLALGSVGAVIIWFKSQALLLLNWVQGPVTISRWEILASTLILFFVLAYLYLRLVRLNGQLAANTRLPSENLGPLQKRTLPKISVIDKKLGLVWEVANNQYWYDKAHLDRGMIDSYVEGPFDNDCKGFVGSELGSRGGIGAYLLVSRCMSCGRLIPIRQTFAAEGIRHNGDLYLTDMKIVVIRALQKYLREGHTLGDTIEFDGLPYAHL